jgi:hypothetical protein
MVTFEPDLSQLQFTARPENISPSPRDLQHLHQDLNFLISKTNYHRYYYRIVWKRLHHEPAGPARRNVTQEAGIRRTAIYRQEPLHHELARPTRNARTAVHRQ